MKKLTIITTSIVCGGVLLFGCTNPAAPANISQKLERNLTALTNVVNRLDTIENSYLSNPDIHPITTTVSAPAPEPNKHVIARIGADSYVLSVPVNNRFKNKIANIDTYNPKSTSNSENTTNLYYYNIQPTKYVPRYIGTQDNGNEDYLKHYISKVRTLYSITNDAIEANNELGKFKNDVITYCVEIKQLNSAIENGTFAPSTNQIAALNNYIDDIKVTIKRIKNCNGDLSNEVNNINNKDVGGITAGIDVINSNYLSVLNHIDTRISYLKNAITTLEQIKFILQEAQEIIINNPTTLEELENNNVVDFNSETTTDNVENNELSEENGIIENEIINNTEPNENIDNNTEIEGETTIQTETETTENNIEQNKENIVDDNIETNLNTDNLEENNETEQTTNNNLVEDVENNESISNEEINNETTEEKIDDENENEQNVTEENNTSNIDTYLNTNSNLDTYKTTQNNSTGSNINNNINTTNNDTALNNINNTNPAITQPIVNGNNLVNNGAILPTDNEKINVPNGTFQNGIITQNNLNNGVNNGVNGTRTGYAGSNNYPYTSGGINRTNKNVDTYGYNTVIDMLNHGTVNNGINTLSVSDNKKPTMVNGNTTIENEEQCEDNLNTECETCVDNTNEVKDLELNEIDSEFSI